jgi:hypothetical protein
MTTDVIIALVTTIGIAVVFSVAMFAAAALNGRGKTRAARIAIPTDHPDMPSDARELVLR